MKTIITAVALLTVVLGMSLVAADAQESGEETLPEDFRCRVDWEFDDSTTPWTLAERQETCEEFE